MDTALKQRLVGTSVIVALAVIFVPMLFNESNTEQNQTISIEIPKEPEGLKHKVISIDGSSINNTSSTRSDNDFNHEDSDESIVVEPKIETQETIIDVIENTKTEIKPDQQVDEVDIVEEIIKPPVQSIQAVKPEPLNEVTINDTEDGDSKSYRIRLGAFSQQKNAQQLKAKIIHAGVDVIVERDAKTGLYKVYSEQFSSKASADNLNNKLQKLNLNIGKTRVEELSKKSSDDAEMLLNTGWIVQIGIYSSKINSIKLRDKIRNKGFICFVDEIQSNTNKTLFRVRVGPFAERTEADTKKTEIKSQLNLSGLIKPHEKQKVVN